MLPSGWLGLADAIERVGQAIYAREWTGSEHHFSLRAKEAHLNQIEVVLIEEVFHDPAAFEAQRDRS